MLLCTESLEYCPVSEVVPPPTGCNFLGPHLFPPGRLKLTDITNSHPTRELTGVCDSAMSSAFLDAIQRLHQWSAARRHLAIHYEREPLCFVMGSDQCPEPDTERLASQIQICISLARIWKKKIPCGTRTEEDLVFGRRSLELSWACSPNNLFFLVLPGLEISTSV